MLPRSKSHSSGKLVQFQTFLRAQSLHQKLILVTVILLIMSGFILLHSIVFSNKQLQENGAAETKSTPAANAAGMQSISFASAAEQAKALTTPNPHLIDLTPPLSRQTLGHATWSLLHTMAAMLPDEPSLEKQNALKAFVHSLAELYPCATCAKHFRGYLKEHPLPSPIGKLSFSQWLCAFHNAVNERLDKPQFQCTKVDTYWPDKLASDCGCAVEEEEKEKAEAAAAAVVSAIPDVLRVADSPLDAVDAKLEPVSTEAPSIVLPQPSKSSEILPPLLNPSPAPAVAATPVVTTSSTSAKVPTTNPNAVLETLRARRNRRAGRPAKSKQQRLAEEHAEEERDKQHAQDLENERKYRESQPIEDPAALPSQLANTITA